MFLEFEKFVSDYDLTNPKLAHKYEHSIKVYNYSLKMSKELGFSKKDQDVAGVIGLLHDIGRFFQLQEYDSYNDLNTMDHGDYGVKLLFEDGLIKKFWDNEDDYEVIKFSIKNHNKFKVEETDNERALLHTKLIRDADKLEIIEWLVGVLADGQTNDDLSDNVVNSFMNCESVLRKDIKNGNDDIVCLLSFIYDINFIENKKYYYKPLLKIIDILNDKFIDIKIAIKDFIEKEN